MKQSFKNIISFIIATGIIFLMFSCQKPERFNKIETLSVEVNGASVKATGELSELGLQFIQSYGFCVALHDIPTIEDNIITINKLPQVGQFSAHINNLVPYSMYFVRAFFYEGNEVVYGNSLSFSINNLDNLIISTLQPEIQTTSSVITDGSITDLGSMYLSAFGHCWSTSPSPTIIDNKTSFGNSQTDTVFTSTLENLSLSTTYYIRSYAVLNTNTVLYGNELSFSIPDLVVATDTFSFPSSNEVLLSGNIVQLGVNPVTQHGFCWSYATPNPTINDGLLALGQIQTTGIFSETMSITNGISYYYRAYASDGIFVKYGNVKQFLKNN